MIGKQLWQLMLKVNEGDIILQPLAAENWKEMWPKEELALGVTSEIYLLERVLQVGAAMVTSELR